MSSKPSSSKPSSIKPPVDSASRYKKIFIGLLSIVLTFLIGYCLLPDSRETGSSEQGANPGEALLPDAAVVRPQVAPAQAIAAGQFAEQTAEDQQAMVQRLAGKFKAELGAQIHLTAVQVSLKALRDDLRAVFEAEGDALFRQIIELAFPAYVEAILQAIAKMDQYDAWLQSMLLNLNDMNAFEQQGVLWEKRRALFGDAATQIWQAEISAEQERQLTMRRTMEMLDKAYDMQMQERLYLLQSNFEESYADKLQNMVVDPKGVLSQVFFGLDAVQQDLARMPNEQRQAQINAIRESMGFTEEQIANLAAADQEREQRWQTGYTYMTERQDLAANLTGEELQRALDKLREKFFQDEAPTIKQEEEELQFFRYQRPRVYGRN